MNSVTWKQVSITWKQQKRVVCLLFFFFWDLNVISGANLKSQWPHGTGHTQSKIQHWLKRSHIQGFGASWDNHLLITLISPDIFYIFIINYKSIQWAMYKVWQRNSLFKYLSRCHRLHTVSGPTRGTSHAFSPNTDAPPCGHTEQKCPGLRAQSPPRAQVQS